MLTDGNAQKVPHKMSREKMTRNSCKWATVHLLFLSVNSPYPYPSVGTPVKLSILAWLLCSDNGSRFTTEILGNFLNDEFLTPDRGRQKQAFSFIAADCPFPELNFASVASRFFFQL